MILQLSVRMMPHNLLPLDHHLAEYRLISKFEILRIHFPQSITLKEIGPRPTLDNIHNPSGIKLLNKTNTTIKQKFHHNFFVLIHFAPAVRRLVNIFIVGKCLLTSRFTKMT